MLMSPDYGWAGPRAAGQAVDIGSTLADPFITADGLELWFMSNAAGSNDLWVSRRASVGSRWGAPVNPGSSINTPDWEAMPRLSSDGLTLTFWRYPIFKTYQATRASKEAAWSTPVEIPGTTNGGSPSLSSDALELFFQVGGKVQYQSRKSRDAAWTPPRPVNELN